MTLAEAATVARNCITIAKDAAIRPVAELLLCCARTSVGAETGDRIKSLLGQDIDWTYLIRTALNQRMLPLLSWHLQTISPQSVSRTTLDRLQRYFYANERRNRLLTQELLRVLNLFDTHGIPVIPFKGPVLAAFVYRNLALRQSGDLDILVRRQDALRARKLLLSQGYQDFMALSDAQEAATLRSGWQYFLVRAEGRVAVDLHWRFTNKTSPFSLALEDLKDRLVPVDLAGTPVLSLSPEDLLVVLCMYGSHRLWTRLEGICAVATLVGARPDMQWPRVIEQAHQLGSERALFLGLLLASTLLATPLPEDVRERADADAVVRSLARHVRERIFAEAEPRLMEWWVSRYKLRECWMARWPLLLELFRTVVIPNAADRAFLRLPASLFFLYYLIRPIRLARQYVLVPLGRSFIGKTNTRQARAGDA